MKHRRVFRNASKLMSKCPFDKTLRTKFLESRAAYKRICRKAEKDSRQRLTRQLIGLGQADPKTFWKIIDKMNRWGREKNDPSDKIAPGTWKKHFEDLLNGGENENIAFDQTHRYGTFEPVLDGIISKKELQDALKGMKCKKSPGPDGILTEYLKIFGDIAEPILLKLIRLMFANHIYPTKWRLNYLKPIYKKGDTQDTNNFRGLAIASALAKLYSLIMLKRLTNYIQANKYISPNQIGFMEGFRCSNV